MDDTVIYNCHLVIYGFSLSAIFPFSPFFVRIKLRVFFVPVAKLNHSCATGKDSKNCFLCVIYFVFSSTKSYFSTSVFYHFSPKFNNLLRKPIKFLQKVPKSLPVIPRLTSDATKSENPKFVRNE